MKEDLDELRGCRDSAVCFSLSFMVLGHHSGGGWGGIISLISSRCSFHVAHKSQATPGLVLCDHPRDALDEGFDSRRTAARRSSHSSLKSCEARFAAATEKK